ncbi:hypothetical protein [Pararhizobium sp.]|uniref:hypothetical protein n=1 Tax=Pararhizobium sp. TaxID=1977563 RepID=UPI002724C2CC|nr:hypothetical protein [Pararhizobium sp.]MDO9415426.1 hypothetical protein [Pararhizobium sp.]
MSADAADGECSVDQLWILIRNYERPDARLRMQAMELLNGITNGRYLTVYVAECAISLRHMIGEFCIEHPEIDVFTSESVRFEILEGLGALRDEIRLDRESRSAL